MSTTINEFTIDLDGDEDGSIEPQGRLIITDASLVSHANDVWVFALGNDHVSPFTVFTELPPQAAHKLLRQTFSDYIRTCQYDLWCDGIMNFWVGDSIALTDGAFGFSDGSYTLIMNVHCNVTADQANALADLTIAESPNVPFIKVTPQGMTGLVSVTDTNESNS